MPIGTLLASTTAVALALTPVQWLTFWKGAPVSGSSDLGATACSTYTRWLADDGCQGAPAGLMSDPGVFTSWLQSGQTFVANPTFPETSIAHPVPFNVAGLDYPVGQTSPSTLDPAVSPPAGCTYVGFSTAGGPSYTDTAWDPTLGNGYPAMLKCKSTSPMTISGYNFGAIGGHGCTVLWLDPSSTGDISIINNRFELTAECASRLGRGGAGGAPSYVGTDAHGPNGLRVNINFISNTILGHAYDPCCKYISSFDNSVALTPPIHTFSLFILNLHTNGTVTIRYNWLQELPGQPIAIGGTCSGNGTGTAFIQYNYFRDFQVRSPQGHGEIANSGCIANATYGFNTIIATKNSAAVWDAAINLGNANGGSTGSGNMVVDGNVGVINSVGGAPNNQLFPNVYGTIAAGGVFTVGYGSPAYPGSNGNFAGRPGPIALGDNLGGGNGPGSTWTIDCGVGTVATLGCALWNSTFPSGINYKNIAAFSSTMPASGFLPLANVKVSNSGSGYSGSGTLTYTGSGCSVPPIVSVTLSGGAIATARLDQNAWVCATLPSGANWTPGGGLVGGSGAILSITGGQISNAVSQNFVDYGHGKYVQVTLQQNFFDPSFMGHNGGGNTFGLRGRDITCLNQTIWGSGLTDNYNITTGAAIAHTFVPNQSRGKGCEGP